MTKLELYRQKWKANMEPVQRPKHPALQKLFIKLSLEYWEKNGVVGQKAIKEKFASLTPASRSFLKRKLRIKLQADPRYVSLEESSSVNLNCNH